jgi:chemotaxis protein MotB
MQVRGFADQRLRKADAPLDPSNRRVSLIVQYQNKKEEADKPDAAEGNNQAKPTETPPASKSPAEH